MTQALPYSHPTLTMPQESHAKLAGQKGGLIKQIKQLELAGQHVSSELQSRMNEVVRKLQKKKKEDSIKEEPENSEQFDSVVFDSDEMGSAILYPNRKKKGELEAISYSKKRKASTQSSITSANRKAKVAKAGLLKGDEAMLNFEPAQDVSTYLPTSLATPVIDRPWVNLFKVQRKVVRYCIVSRI